MGTRDGGQCMTVHLSDMPRDPVDVDDPHMPAWANPGWLNRTPDRGAYQRHRTCRPHETTWSGEDPCWVCEAEKREKATDA